MRRIPDGGGVPLLLLVLAALVAAALLLLFVFQDEQAAGGAPAGLAGTAPPAAQAAPGLAGAGPGRRGAAVPAVPAEELGRHELPVAAAPADGGTWVTGALRLDGLRPAEVRVRLCRVNQNFLDFVRDGDAQVRAALVQRVESWKTAPDWPDPFVWTRLAPHALEPDGSYAIPVDLPADDQPRSWRVEAWWTPDWTAALPQIDPDLARPDDDLLVPAGSLPLAYSPSFDLQPEEVHRADDLLVRPPLAVELRADLAMVPPAVRPDFSWALAGAGAAAEGSRALLLSGPWNAPGNFRVHLPPRLAGVQARLRTGAGAYWVETPSKTLTRGLNVFGPEPFPAPATIRGRVSRRSNGSAVIGRRVRLHPLDGGGTGPGGPVSAGSTTETDREGRFEFFPAAPGRYAVQTYEDPWGQPVRTHSKNLGPLIEEDVTVAAGGLAELEIVIGRPLLELTVKVEGVPEGSPMLVFSWDDEGESWPPRIESENPFTVQALAGHHIHLRAIVDNNQTDEPFVEAHGDFDPSLGADASVVLAPHPTRVELKPPAPLPVPAVVLYSEDYQPDDSPLASRTQWRHRHPVALPADGSARVLEGLPPGRYTVRTLGSKPGEPGLEWELRVP